MGRPNRKSTCQTKALAERLEDLVEERENQGVTREEICEANGFSTSSLSGWLNDTKTASYENLCSLAKYFGVSTDYLLGMVDVRTSNTEIKSVCMSTGLREDFVRQTVELRKEPDLHNELNRVLVPDDMYTLLANLANYTYLLEKLTTSVQRDKRKLEKFQKQLAAHDLDSVEFGDGTNMLEDSEDAYADVRYFRFEIIDFFTKIFDKLYGIALADKAIGDIREMGEKIDETIVDLLK